MRERRNPLGLNDERPTAHRCGLQAVSATSQVEAPHEIHSADIEAVQRAIDDVISRSQPWHVSRAVDARTSAMSGRRPRSTCDPTGDTR